MTGSSLHVKTHSQAHPGDLETRRFVHPVCFSLGLVLFHLMLYLCCLDGLAAHGEPAVSLKVVFLPLLAFQAIILIDNFR